MDPKNSLFLMLGIALCGMGVLLLLFGYPIYKNEATTFDIMTIILFMQLVPEFNLDFSLIGYYFYPYIYYLDIVFRIYIILLEFIQNTLQPFIITVFLPISGLICITIGGIFFVCNLITYR